MSNYATGSITPVLLPIVLEFKISLDQASYLITCNILTLGLGVRLPLFSEKYILLTRRPESVLGPASPEIWQAASPDYLCSSLLRVKYVARKRSQFSHWLTPK